MRCIYWKKKFLVIKIKQTTIERKYVPTTRENCFRWFFFSSFYTQNEVYLLMEIICLYKSSFNGCTIFTKGSNLFVNDETYRVFFVYSAVYTYVQCIFRKRVSFVVNVKKFFLFHSFVSFDLNPYTLYLY